MQIGKIIRDAFYNTGALSRHDLEKSRRMSICEGCTARSVYNLTSGAFLAGFASYLGSDDAFNGIIGAIPVLAGVAQLFSPIFFEKLETRKLQIVILNFLHRFILGLMVFIPLLAADRTSRLILLAIMYFIAYLAVSFSNPASSGLIIDLVPENIRGKYFGKRESYILTVATTVTLVLGRVLDAYRASGNEYGGFSAVFSVVLVLSFANFFFWCVVKEPPFKRNKALLKVRDIILIPLKNTDFRKVIIFFIIYNIGLQVGGPFFAVYMVTGLKLDYTYIMLMSMVSTLVNVILSRVWGRIADKRSWDFVLKYSILMLGLTHFTWSFVEPATAFVLVPLLHVAGGASWAGITISTFNIQFIYSPGDGRTVYIGFNAAIGGLVGFLGTLAGSALLIIFGKNGLNISNFKIGGMQLLFLLSGILLILGSAYVHFFIRRPLLKEQQ